MSENELSDLLSRFGLDELDWSSFFTYDFEQDGYKNSPPDILYKYLSPGNFERFSKNLKLRVSQKPVLNDVFEFRGRAKEVIDNRFRTSIRLALDTALKKLLARPDFLVFLLRKAALHDGILITPEMAGLLNAIVLDPISKGALQEFISSHLKNWEDMLNEHLDEMASALNNPFATEFMLQRAGMLCLSANPLNQPMWAHYADNGKGAVVGIRTSSNCFFRPPAPVKPRSAILGKVRYSNEIAECVFDDLYSIFLNKHTDWSYEQEWRGIYKLDELELSGNDPNGHEIYLIEFSPSDIAEIYFGYNADLDRVMDLQVPMIISGVSARTCYVTGFSVEGLVAEHCVGD